MEVLDLRRLNRATLARQCLLERVDGDVTSLVGRVGGLQAQLPAPPVLGIWSRLDGFDRSQLHAAIASGRLVRGTTLRGTLHLHAVDEYRTLRMGLQPVLDVHVRSLVTRGLLTEQDVESALAIGRELLADAALTVAELRTALAERLPDRPAQALLSAVRHGLPLLLEPDVSHPDGWRGTAPFTAATRLIGAELPPSPGPEWFVRRFLEVLGPGTAKDVQTWSGLRRIAPVLQRMHDSGELIELVTWEGTSLWDLRDAPRPSDEQPAPPRFLPMWDDVLLSHADRSRLVHPDWRPFLASRNGMSPPTFLIDGFVHGTWAVESAVGGVTLQLTPFARIPTRHEDLLVAEGERLLRFLHPDSDRLQVRFG